MGYDIEKEKREAIEAGRRALNSLSAAKENLNSAKNWGLVDMPVSYTHLDVYKRQGWNNRFVIHIVKMKMPTTSSDIDNLIIQASPWTVGW